MFRRSAAERAWAVLATLVLWIPSRLTGALDGIPLDRPAEAIGLGLVLPFLALFHPYVFRLTWARVLCVALLVWKAGSSLLLVQDGFCLRFVTAEPVYRDMGRVPHTWDVRADWRSPTPDCSAIQSRSYERFEDFPIWFFNLPPASNQLPSPTDRPPRAVVDARWSGYVISDGGSLRLLTGEGMQAQVTVDGSAVPPAVLSAGFPLSRGVHHVAVDGVLTGDRWRFEAFWNESDLFERSRVVVSPPSAVDRAVRPLGSAVTSTLSLLLLCGWTVSFVRRSASATLIAWAVPAAAAAVAVVRVAGDGAGRWVPLLIAAGAFAPVPQRRRNLIGLLWLVIVPWLALIGARAMPEVGRSTLYTAGDDWWMFQRFAYRIYLQGYWLEGGQETFWFQPLYRWIAGALHLVFGDSSMGEMLWDGGAIAAGAIFTGIVVRRFLGFRWSVAAAALCLSLYTLGPAWYLIGRGLAELSSAGFIYGAALCAWLARRGNAVAIAGTAICVTMAFYTRLNNLPMCLAVAGCAFAMSVPARDLWRPRRWWTSASRSTLLAVLGGLFVGLNLFSLRTWYYTGRYDLLHGTQSAALSVWAQPHDDPTSTVVERLIESLLMVISMSDPPRFDVRALPLIVGTAAAALAVLGVGRFRSLPASVVGLCLAGVASSLVARGSAYPGRFSVHIIPAAVAVTFCALAAWIPVRQPARAAERVERPQVSARAKSD